MAEQKVLQKIEKFKKDYMPEKWVDENQKYIPTEFLGHCLGFESSLNKISNNKNYLQ